MARRKSGEKFKMSRILGYLEENKCIKIKSKKCFANTYLKVLSECVSALRKVKSLTLMDISCGPGKFWGGNNDEDAIYSFLPFII